MSNFTESITNSSPLLAIKKILMIKSHSMGIGDLLRSSAAWRALKDKWPDAELHLVFLSKHPGYATEELIKDHHLLSSATFLTLRENSPHIAKAKRTPYFELKTRVQELVKVLKPDLVIDFEASGIRTSLLTRIAAKACKAKTVGINQFLGRSLLYNYSAPSTAYYAKERGLTLPMDYTNRDFVVLSALGIERENRPIELNVSAAGNLYAEQLRKILPLNISIIGLNIGCGTPDAVHKRPNLNDLVECIGQSVRNYPHSLLLSGAPFEKDINEKFITAYAARWGDTSHIYNLAGETTTASLGGLINLVDLFISTDSGPYHMAVAMKKPTIVWFTYLEATSFHDHSWCKYLINPTPKEFTNLFFEIIKYK